MIGFPPNAIEKKRRKACKYGKLKNPTKRRRCKKK